MYGKWVGIKYAKELIAVAKSIVFAVSDSNLEKLNTRIGDSVLWRRSASKLKICIWSIVPTKNILLFAQVAAYPISEKRSINRSVHRQLLLYYTHRSYQTSVMISHTSKAHPEPAARIRSKRLLHSSTLSAFYVLVYCVSSCKLPTQKRSTPGIDSSKDFVINELTVHNVCIRKS